MASRKSSSEISLMREGGEKLSRILGQVCDRAVAGANAKDLDAFAERRIREEGGTPSFKGYEGFPGTLCVSVNEEIVHGAPLASKVFREGDIVSLDIGMKYEGFHTDMAVTIPIGKVADETRRLLRVTKKALKRGVKKVRAGVRTGDIGNTIQRYVESQGFSVVKELCGHGIGKELHEDPQIPNFGKRGKGFPLKEGMVICIEPMVAEKDWRIRQGRDGYAYCTNDGLLSAHCECMIAVGQDGGEVLTPLPGPDLENGEGV